MVETQRSVASFLVRFTQDLWEDAEGEPRVQWRGQISHVQGDDTARFTDFAQAVAFIQDRLTQLTLDVLSDKKHIDQQKALDESVALWKQFASSYSTMMLEAMQQTAERSQALKGQMNEAMVRAFAGRAEPRQLVEQLEALQAQVNALGERVEALEKQLEEHAS